MSRKSDIGYILMKLWIDYTRCTSGNIRLDRYRKANILNQMITLFLNTLKSLGENIESIEKELSKAQCIINDIFHHRVYEQKIEEFYQYTRGIVNEIIIPREIEIKSIGYKDLSPWGNFKCIVDVLNYINDLVEKRYEFKAEYIIESINKMLLGLKIGAFYVIRDDKELEKFWNSVEQLKIVIDGEGIKLKASMNLRWPYNLLFEARRPHSLFNFNVPGKYVYDFVFLKQPKLLRDHQYFKVLEITSKGAMVEYYDILTESDVIQLLDYYTNLVMVESIKQGFIRRELLKGIYLPTSKGFKESEENEANTISSH